MTDSLEEESKHLRELLSEALREVERLKEWQHKAKSCMHRLIEKIPELKDFVEQFL